MRLWLVWWSAVSELRPACTRVRTFLWMTVALAGLCIRVDLRGVTSLVRTFGLQRVCYDRLLDFFHSSALDPDRLSRLWTAVVLRRFPVLPRVRGRLILLADGIKVPKAGFLMPAVKGLKQVESNTKPEFIRGHSCQAISLVAGAAQTAFAVPLASRIHEGLVFSNRDKRTLPTKLFSLLQTLGLPEPVTLVADAYYACRTFALPLLAHGSHLVSRVRINAVAFSPARKVKHRRRGRPQLYGRKVRLRSLFEATSGWIEALSPVYGERDVVIRYHVADLLWRPLKRLVRFVVVDHPTRGKTVLLCTDLEMPPIEVIRLYGIRFKIELSFKQALRVLGAYAYHFWMQGMKPLTRRSGNQYLHRESEKYRTAVRRKMAAYHRYIQLALVAQGLLQLVAIRLPTDVWASFGSWLRTIRAGIPPSESVTALALKNALPEFLAGSGHSLPFSKFLRDRIDPEMTEGLRLAG